MECCGTLQKKKIVIAVLILKAQDMFSEKERGAKECV